MAMNPGDGNPRSPDDTRLASAGTPPASPPSTLAPPVDVLLATDKGGGADCFFTPSSRSPAEGDAFSSSLGSLSFSHSAPPMPGARAETTADLQGQEQEQEPCQVGPQQQEFHHHHQQQQQRTPFPPVPWAEQREGGGGSGGRKEAMGIPRARGAQERSEVAVLGGPAEEASGWMLYLEHNSVLQQQAPDMQACVLIKRARDREHLFRGTMPAMMLKSPHCYDLQVRFCGVDQRLVMNSILRVSLFERDGTLVTAAFCDSDGEPILSDQTTSYVLQQGNGKVYGSTRSAFLPF